MKKIISRITSYFWVIFLGAVILGLLFPQEVSPTYSLLTPLVIIVMYLGSLDIEYHKLGSIKQYRKSIILYIIVMTIILPVGLFYGVSLLSIDVATGVFLLAIAPAGIASIAFTRLMGGNTLLALCLTVITTLLIPFVLPLLSQILLSNVIQIDSLSMFIDLVIYCIIPLGAGYCTQRFLPHIVTKISPHLDRISIVLIAIMIAGPVAYNADKFLSISLRQLFYTVGLLFIVSAIIHSVGWICFGNNRENNIAGALSKGFMNISLATVIAATYFSPEALLIVLLYEFPRDLMLIPYKWFIKKKDTP